jgi:nickel-dependent lactate racemase
VATGLHEPCGDEELRRIVGPEVRERYPVRNHDAVDPAENVHLGVTQAGTGVYINRHYLEADCKVLTGLIEPHFMAGFSGGRKCLCPGIAGLRTIAATHAPRFIADAGSAPGVIDGNPFHREITEAARMALPHFILNAALNDEREITGVFAGDMEKAFMEGVRFVARSHTASLPREADVVVTSGGGEPLDRTLYQAVKGMVGALEVVRTGGTIIIASRCAAGIGSHDFADSLESFKGADAFMHEASSPGYFKKDAWEVIELCKALKKARIMMFTGGINGDALLRCGIIPAEGIEGAVWQCLREYGKNASVAVIPQGPYLIAARA